MALHNFLVAMEYDGMMQWIKDEFSWRKQCDTKFVEMLKPLSLLLSLSSTSLSAYAVTFFRRCTDISNEFACQLTNPFTKLIHRTLKLPSYTVMQITFVCLSFHSNKFVEMAFFGVESLKSNQKEVTIWAEYAVSTQWQYSNNQILLQGNKLILSLWHPNITISRDHSFLTLYMFCTFTEWPLMLLSITHTPTDV